MTDSIPPNDILLKRCPDCPENDQWHPVTTEFFGKDKNQKDKLGRVCKNCKNAYYRIYTKRPEYREYLKTWNDENQERRKAYSQTYRESPKGRERGNAYRKEYESRPEVRVRRNIWNKTWNEAHLGQPENREQRRAYYRRPEIQEQKRAYRASPQGKEVHRANSHRRRSRQKEVTGTYTPEQIQVQLKAQGYKCYYAACGHAKFKKQGKEYIYHIDHTFPLNRVAGTDIPANDISYLVLACPTCNQSKNDKFPWEWPEGGRLL